jgi:hypothetical protein
MSFAVAAVAATAQTSVRTAAHSVARSALTASLRVTWRCQLPASAAAMSSAATPATPAAPAGGDVPATSDDTVVQPAVQYAADDLETAVRGLIADRDLALRAAYDRRPPADYPAHAQDPASMVDATIAYRKRLLYRSKQRGW